MLSMLPRKCSQKYKNKHFKKIKMLTGIGKKIIYILHKIKFSELFNELHRLEHDVVGIAGLFIHNVSICSYKLMLLYFFSSHSQVVYFDERKIQVQTLSRNFFIGLGCLFRQIKL